MLSLRHFSLCRLSLRRCWASILCAIILSALGGCGKKAPLRAPADAKDIHFPGLYPKPAAQETAEALLTKNLAKKEAGIKDASPHAKKDPAEDPTKWG